MVVEFIPKDYEGSVSDALLSAMHAYVADRASKPIVALLSPKNYTYVYREASEWAKYKKVGLPGATPKISFYGVRVKYSVWLSDTQVCFLSASELKGIRRSCRLVFKLKWRDKNDSNKMPSVLV